MGTLKLPFSLIPLRRQSCVRERKFGAVGAHAEDLDAAFVAHKQLGVARVHSYRDWTVIEFSIFVRPVWLPKLVRCLKSESNTWMRWLFCQRRKDGLGSRRRFGKACWIGRQQRLAAYCVHLFALFVEHHHLMKLKSLTSTWPRLLKQTENGRFSTSWPKERTNFSDASNTHTRLFPDCHTRTHCFRSRLLLHLEGWSVFHRCLGRRFRRECGEVRRFPRRRLARGGCSSRPRTDETDCPQLHHMDSSVDCQLSLGRCRRSHADTRQKQDRGFELDGCSSSHTARRSLWVRLALIRETCSCRTVCAWRMSGRWAYCAGVGAWTRGSRDRRGGVCRGGCFDGIALGRVGGWEWRRGTGEARTWTE